MLLQTQLFQTQIAFNQCDLFAQGDQPRLAGECITKQITEIEHGLFGKRGVCGDELGDDVHAVEQEMRSDPHLKCLQARFQSQLPFPVGEVLQVEIVHCYAADQHADRHTGCHPDPVDAACCARQVQQALQAQQLGDDRQCRSHADDHEKADGCLQGRAAGLQPAAQAAQQQCCTQGDPEHEQADQSHLPPVEGNEFAADQGDEQTAESSHREDANQRSSSTEIGEKACSRQGCRSSTGLRADIMKGQEFPARMTNTGSIANMTDSESRNDALWGGRFKEPTDAFVARFTASERFDRRMYQQDLRGSLAHAAMLAEVGVLTPDEAALISSGLEQVRTEIESGRFQWRVEREDVHMNIEARLTELVGDVGKKLHTGRSRNDQVATDIRLWLRDEAAVIRSEILRLLAALAELAEREAGSVFPGFTHLQSAQPVTFGHHMLAWAEMLKRDAGRLDDAMARMNALPLGAAALAGTTFPIDRHAVARTLGFDRLCENSLDAVSDRDFAIEFCAFASLLMVHLSRFSEELVLWTSAQFALIDLPDRFCTGSSIMPQKKNPDVPELVRGKSGRVCGHLVSLLMLMKAQPLAYNKDNQEDKEPLFDTVDTVRDALKAFADMMPAVILKRDNARHAALRGFATATDLADYLVRKGLPFRDAHEVVGAAVAACVEQGVDLAELPLEVLRSYSAVINEDVFAVLTLDGSVAARNHPGGTAPEQVRRAVGNLRQWLSERT